MLNEGAEPYNSQGVERQLILRSLSLGFIIAEAFDLVPEGYDGEVSLVWDAFLRLRGGCS
jgi:hypothetical protein